MNAAFLELEILLAYHWLIKDYSHLHLPCPCNTRECLVFLKLTIGSTTVMDGFKAKDIGLRVQKKILSRMSTKNVAKVFIDERSANILDNLYKLVKDYSGSKKEAEKFVKNLIKIVVKIAVLYRHDQLTKEDYVLAEKFKNRFNAAALAIISFYEVDFSYDRTFLMKHLTECQAALSVIVQRHLTDKSLLRVKHVFEVIGNHGFLDVVFRRDSPYRPTLAAIVKDMSEAMDAGEL